MKGKIHMKLSFKKIAVMAALLCTIFAVLAVTAMAAPDGLTWKNVDATEGTTNDLQWAFDTSSSTIYIKGDATEMTLAKAIGYDASRGWAVNSEDIPWVACSGLAKKIVFETPNLTSIPTLIFYRHQYIEEIVLPKSVTKLGTACFQECTVLKTISIYGEESVSGTINLENITEVGGNLFEKALAATNITVLTSKTGKSIDGSSFKSVENPTSITVMCVSGSDNESAVKIALGSTAGEYTYVKNVLKTSYYDGSSAPAEEPKDDTKTDDTKTDDTKKDDTPKQTVQETKTAKAVYGTPEIDGIIDPIWADCDALDFPYDRQDATETKLAVPMVFDDESKAPYAKVMWDEKNLYVLWVVYDETVNSAATIQDYNRDGVECIVDEFNDKPLDRSAQATHHMTLSTDGSFFDNGGATMTYVASSDGNYRIVELKYTFDKLVPKTGDVLGFDVSVNMNDTGLDVRDHCLSWNDQTNATWYSLVYLGNLELTGGEGVNEGTETKEEETKKDETATTPDDNIIAQGVEASQYSNLTWVLTNDGTLTFTATKDGWNEVPYNNGGDVSNRWYNYNDKIVKVIVGEGLSKIGKGAFVNCPNLESIEFASVGQLAAEAFVNCPKLTTIYYKGNTPVEGTYDFSKISSLEGANVVQNCGVTSIILTGSLTKVLENRIVDCAYLTNITFGEKLEEINANAFTGCYNLKVLFGANDQSPAKAFAEANGMTFAVTGTDVDIPEAVVTTVAPPETTAAPDTTTVPETTTAAPDTTTAKKDDDKATQTGDVNVAMIVAFAVAALGSAIVLSRKKRFN